LFLCPWCGEYRNLSYLWQSSICVCLHLVACVSDARVYVLRAYKIKNLTLNSKRVQSSARCTQKRTWRVRSTHDVDLRMRSDCMMNSGQLLHHCACVELARLYYACLASVRTASFMVRCVFVPCFTSHGMCVVRLKLEEPWVWIRLWLKVFFSKILCVCLRVFTRESLTFPRYLSECVLTERVHFRMWVAIQESTCI